VEDLAFATMFEGDNVLAPELSQLNIEDEINSVINKLKSLQDYVEVFKTLSLHISISAEVPRWILVDKSLRRVLHNMISNAVRFTPVAYGRVAVSVSFEPKSPPEGSLSVRVTNAVECEMDLVAVNKAFQHYYDADSRSMANTNSKESLLTDSLTATQGVGLGLYVSYNIVQIMGGLLECSAASSESAFWFTIPVKCDLLASTAATTATATTAEKSKTASSDSSSLQTSLKESLIDSDSRHSSDVSLLAQSLEVTTVAMDRRKAHYTSPESERWTSVTESSAAAQHVLINTQGASAEVAAAAASAAFLKRKRILVVDDSPICQKVLTKTLRNNHYDADVASNGKVCEWMC